MVVCKKKPPFEYVEPDIWQIPVLVGVQALIAYGFNIAGWSIDPITFFFIPIILGILFWKEQSFKIIADYLGFNTKNLPQKILASIVGAALGLSIFFILKYTRLTLIPFATWKFGELMVAVKPFLPGITGILQALPIILTFLIIMIISSVVLVRRISPIAVGAIILALILPFFLVYVQPIGIINMIIGFGEEILCLLFAMIAINWLVCRYGLDYKYFKAHILAWFIARSSWAVIHALSTYGFVLGAYIAAFILGIIFTLIGYMFWYTYIAIPILFLIGAYDVFLGFTYNIFLLQVIGTILLTTSIALTVDKEIFKDESLALKEYVIYGAAMAHAFYDLSFTLFL